LLARLICWLAVRRQGIYFAMITLAHSQMIYFICVQAPFTFAEDGIQSIPRGKLFGLFSLQNDFAMYYFILALGLATLTDVSWQMSGEVVLMTLLGGMGTILGPVLGATAIVAMQNYLSQFGSWVTIIVGITFVVCVLLFRRGIVGEIAHRWKK
jgi:ABC-type branched-subunit amino acid transport system permease subunit